MVIVNEISSLLVWLNYGIVLDRGDCAKKESPMEKLSILLLVLCVCSSFSVVEVLDEESDKKITYLERIR